MKKWAITIVVILGLLSLSLTTRWWLPQLLSFVGANNNTLQGLSSLIQIVLWGGSAVIIMVKLWRPAKTASIKEQGSSKVIDTRASGDNAANIAVAGNAETITTNIYNIGSPHQAASSAPTDPPVNVAHSLIDEFRYHTNNVLRHARLTITGLDRTFRRAEVSTIEDQLKLAKPVILKGAPGTGKSGIGVLLARAALDIGKAVLLLDARHVHHIEDEAGLRRFFSINEPVSYAIARLGREHGCRLIIDQLDNTIDLAIARVLVGLALECSRATGVEVVVISRDREGHESRLLQSLTAEGFVELESRQLNEEEAQAALVQIGISRPSSDLLNLSRNLLNLDIIATIKNRQPHFDFSNILDEVALWDGYIDVLLEREEEGSNRQDAEQTLAEAMRLAKSMLCREEQSFTLDSPLSPALRRLNSWGMIISEEGQIYRFRHEKLQDYLYARDAVNHGLMPQAVLAEINVLRSRHVLLWMNKLYAHRKSPRRAQFLREMLNVE